MGANESQNTNSAGSAPSGAAAPASAGGKKLHEEPVLLNVYNPRPEEGKQQFQMPGFGVHHTGLEVYGTEYMFAGGEGAGGSGIHPQPPRVSPPGSPWLYDKTVKVGVTTMTRTQIQDLVSRMGGEFPANSYHIMGRNCNHFTDALAKRITTTKAGIPSWVNRTANLGNSLFGPAAASGPKAEAPAPKPNPFAGPGHRLDGSAAPAASSAKKSAAKPAAKAAAGAGGAAASRKNPWRDPNFMPGAKDKGPASPTSDETPAERPESKSVTA
jgi:hypothetical protein